MYKFLILFVLCTILGLTGRVQAENVTLLTSYNLSYGASNAFSVDTAEYDVTVHAGPGAPAGNYVLSTTNTYAFSVDGNGNIVLPAFPGGPTKIINNTTVTFISSKFVDLSYLVDSPLPGESLYYPNGGVSSTYSFSLVNSSGTNFWNDTESITAYYYWQWWWGFHSGSEYYTFDTHTVNWRKPVTKHVALDAYLVPHTDNSPPGGTCSCCGMAGYSFDMLRGTLRVQDTPLSYPTPVGPGVSFTSTYNQANVGQLSNSPFSNLGPQWTYNWLTYIVGNPDTGPAPITRFAPGGGLEYYTGFQVAPGDQWGSYNSTTQIYSFNQSSIPEQHTQAVLHWDAVAGQYTRTLPDGSYEVYGEVVVSQGTSYYLITQQTDAQGNTIVFGYDANNRLVSVTDAIKQMTTLFYATPTDLKIDHITAPFGPPFTKTVQFTYDSQGRLQSATDPQGIVSIYGYDNTNFLNALTTPYATTTFSTDSDVNHQGVTATNPLGQSERAELRFNSPSGVSDSATVPTVTGATLLATGTSGLSQNNTYYWDRRQYTSPLVYTNAVITHWMNGPRGFTNIVDSQQKPLEGRVWYNYSGQSVADMVNDSVINKPTITTRIIDGGSTQAYLASYSPTGLITKSVDPLLRTTNYNYDPNNGIDLLTVTQANSAATGGQDLLSTMSYTSATQPNDIHLPVQIVDAAGQTTLLTYNTQGQLTSRTVTVGGSNQTTTLSYASRNGTGSGNFMTLATGPSQIPGATTSYTYDTVGRVLTTTDSEGYTLTMAYDNLDRVTSTTYPDAAHTTDQTLYNNPATPLDVAQTIDRQGRTTTNQYDAIRELVQTTDPLGRTTKYGWCTCGGLATLTDANGNVTTWNHDLQGRVTSKVYADSSTITYRYTPTSGGTPLTSRLYFMQDAVGNVSNYSYNTDNTLASVSYTPATGVAATPTVDFFYDTPYNRVTKMRDIISGTNYDTNYSYYPITPPALGAGRLQTVTVPIEPTSYTASVAYTYDELGRVLTRTIDGANPVGTTYDALGRVTNITNALAPSAPGFQYAYYDPSHPTSRLGTVTYPSSTGMSTSYSYYGDTAATGTGNGDERLETIQNFSNNGSTQLSQFGYTYNPVGTIATWSQQTASGSTAVQDTLTYDAADQLINSIQSGGGTASNAYNYDPAGNRLLETTASATTAGQFNNLNQLTGYGSNTTTAQTVSGYTSSAVTNVTVNAVPASISNNTNFSASVHLPNGSNVVSVVAEPSSSTNAPITQRYGILASGASSSLTTLGYDANGNVHTDENGNTYTWDALNRLASITYPSSAGGGSSTFAYDGLSRRVQIVDTTGGGAVTTKNYLWIGQEIAEERASNNSVTKRFFPQGEQQSGANYYYTRDHLGSVRELCNSSGTILTRYSYDPYGRTTPNYLVTSPTTTDATFRYAGYYAHPASGFYFTKYRAYDSNIGRWLSRDPRGEKARVNLFAYVGDNPVSRVDHLGLQDNDDDPAEEARKKLLEEVEQQAFMNRELNKIMDDQISQTITETFTPPIDPTPGQESPQNSFAQWEGWYRCDKVGIDPLFGNCVYACKKSTECVSGNCPGVLGITFTEPDGSTDEDTPSDYLPCDNCPQSMESYFTSGPGGNPVGPSGTSRVVVHHPKASN